MTGPTYNGWKNRQTWNVALWLQNDEPLYRAACAYAEGFKARGGKCNYAGFILSQGLEDCRTPDGIGWTGSRLDYPALNRLLREMVA